MTKQRKNQILTGEQAFLHDVDIRIEHNPIVSYAMAHNRIAPIHRVTLTNRGAELRGAAVRAVISDHSAVLSLPFERLVDIPAGESVVLDDFEVRLDGSAMYRVVDQRPGQVVVSLHDADSERGRAEVEVDVLPGTHWILAEPRSLSAELLAAHVMPNSPEVVDILKDASERLRQGTGSPSLEGYQAGAERVLTIAKAIYETVQSRRIRYAEPPSSWGSQGQKVRTPAEVLNDRVGTCLDTTVLLAACLEQAGIRPVLWLFKDHAFVGYWLEQLDLGGIVHTDAREVVNRIDLGLMKVLETTCVTDRPEDVTFEDATRLAYASQLTADVTDVLVVDVVVARNQQVFPLPARSTNDSGAPVVVEYRPAEHSRAPVVITGGRAAATSAEGAASAGTPPRVVQWKNALLDLTLRNKLINFTANHTVNVALPGSSLGFVEDLLHASKPIHLLASDQVDDVMRERGIRFGRDLPEEARTSLVEGRSSAYTDVTSASYPTRFRSLAYRARTIVEETGANNLYLALGSLVWTFDGRDLRSPLILVPVNLVTKARQAGYRIELDESGQSTPNFCLLEKLKQSLGITIPGLANPEADDSGIDLDAAFRAVRVVMAEKGLPFRVEATADIAILQFAKFRLWKDLDENWDEFIKNDLVRHLVETPTEGFQDSHEISADVANLDALATQCPIPADSSQLTAIADAVAGRTFVLEGPPGTGKSQTITNLLARAMADGRRVLFVAEKRAALDVVKSRLDAVGMGPFSLDLHDKGSKPVAVREQLKIAIDHRADVDRQGLQARTEDTASAARRLTRYAQRLHEQNGAGLSLYSATTQLLTVRDDVPSLSVPHSLLGAPSSIDSIRQVLRTLPEVADAARPQRHHPWGFVDVDQIASTSVDDVCSSLKVVESSLALLRSRPELGPVLASVRSVADLRTTVGILRGPTYGLATLDETRTERWRSAAAATRSEIHAFVAAAHPGLDQAVPNALTLPLADIHARAKAAQESSWFGRKKRLLAVLAELGPGLRDGHTVTPKQLTQLTGALVQLQGAVVHLANRTVAVPGLTVPPGWNPLTEEGATVVVRQIEWLEWAGGAVAANSHGTPSVGDALRKLLDSGVRLEHELVSAIEDLANCLGVVFDATGATEASLAEWAGELPLLTRWESTAAGRSTVDPQLQSLVRWLDLRRALSALSSRGMEPARQTLLAGKIEADDALDAFERGLAEASVDERLLASGLDSFDVSNHERSIDRFRDSSTQVQGMLTGALPDEVVSARSFSASSEVGRIGALRRELSKTRRGLGVRSLMDQYGDLVTQLTPCVLVSPDSLARFFPAKANQFDLVVFDEASQIRVADAIGAMGRASSVVVVGDSKQMPPTSIAESTIDIDSEEAEVELVVEDEESILTECVLARVPQHWLSWHYRSQDESLISFSNVHYYEGRLSSFPSPLGAASPGVNGHGVSLIKVDGHFHRSGKGKLLRTNPTEAEAVVAEITRRFDAAPNGSTPSIGVVTFNQQQRAYIEALIRDSKDSRLAEALDDPEREGLFIKNLENVQGDERDVILFSTAFSVNDKGVLPLNFGPLNRGGGERRLNVAVTRARRQVVVFSSFDPKQLRAEETTSRGIKHLRAYLDVAEQGAHILMMSGAARRVADRHRETVADALRERGFAVRTDVGLSDFRVDIVVADGETPERPLAAILLDTPGWADRRTVGDRDGLPREVLGRMLRWPRVERIWLPSWLADRESVLSRLEQRLREPQESHPLQQDAPPVRRQAADGTHQSAPSGESALVRASGSAHFVNPSERALYDAADEPVSSMGDEPAEPNADEIAPLVPTSPVQGDGATRQAFNPWQSGFRGGRDLLDGLDWSRSARGLVRDAIFDAVEAEGPIQQDRLARTVAAAFDLNRVNAKRMDSILAQAPVDLRRGPEPDVLWPAELEPKTWAHFRSDPDAQRPIEHVPLTEISNALATLCQEAGGIERAEAMRAALLEFGFIRMTQGVTIRLEAALELGLTTGRLSLDGGFLTTRRNQ